MWKPATMLTTLKLTSSTASCEDLQNLEISEDATYEQQSPDYCDEADDETGGGGRIQPIIVHNGTNSLSRCLSSNRYTCTIYTLLLLLLTASCLCLVCITFWVVLPFETVRDFVNGTCVPSVLVVQDGKTCICGAGCSAKYRCLTIKVLYDDPITGRARNATVYENEANLGKEVM